MHTHIHVTSWHIFFSYQGVLQVRCCLPSKKYNNTWLLHTFSSMVKKTCGMTQLKLLFLKWEHLPELIWVLWTWQVWAKNYNLMRISKLTGSMFIWSAYSNWYLRLTFGSYLNKKFKGMFTIVYQLWTLIYKTFSQVRILKVILL